MPLKAVLNLDLKGLYSLALDLATANCDLNFSRSVSWDDGSGQGQAAKIFHDSRTLTTGASETIDVSGALSDALGQVLSLTKVKAIVIVSRSTNTTVLSVGPNSTNGLISPFNAAADRVKIQPGGVFVLASPDANGYAVTAGTADLLFVANAAGASADYDIIIIGA